MSAHTQKTLKTMQKKPHYSRLTPENPWLLSLAVAALIGGALLVASYLYRADIGLFSCGRGGAWGGRADDGASLALQMEAIRHYATSKTVPQQSFKEITVSYEVLRSLGPVNFLVFGLGHDSLMWAGLNARGKTLFLEEDPEWVKTVLKEHPTLRADTVRYRTQLSEADELMHHFGTEPECSPKEPFIRGNDKCRLALNMLSNEVYDTEWDMIMIDAPRGWFPEAPGRMAAIYSAAVMARNRKKSGVTHIFLHDVDRKVEKMYAEAFLCKKHLVNGVEKLWHFAIPPASSFNTGFC